MFLNLPTQQHTAFISTVQDGRVAKTSRKRSCHYPGVVSSVRPVSLAVVSLSPSFHPQIQRNHPSGCANACLIRLGKATITRKRSFLFRVVPKRQRPPVPGLLSFSRCLPLSEQQDPTIGLFISSLCESVIVSTMRRVLGTAVILLAILLSAVHAPMPLRLDLRPASSCPRSACFCCHSAD